MTCDSAITSQTTVGLFAEPHSLGNKQLPRALVITANYTSKELVLPDAFLRSLRATGTDADVLIIANHSSEACRRKASDLMPGTHIWRPIPRQRYRGVRYLTSTFPRLGRLLGKSLKSIWVNNPSRRHSAEYWAAHLLNITCSRYLLARRFLAQTDAKYDFVMLSDSRDVIFQRDPFLELPTGVTTGVESVFVRDEPSNVEWLNYLYGQDTSFPMENVFSTRVICSGVTLGDTPAISVYLDRMCEAFMNLLPRIVHRQYLDQGVHIALLRTQGLPGLNLSQNGQPWIATVGTSDLSEFRLQSRQLLGTDDLPVSIVHQYDRHPELAEAILENLDAPNY